MVAMFKRATNFNQNISIWDVSEVTNMNAMFDRAMNFNQDISDWDVSGVTNMYYMFSGATNFDQDLQDWDTGDELDCQGFATNAGCSLAHCNLADYDDCSS